MSGTVNKKTLAAMRRELAVHLKVMQKNRDKLRALHEEMKEYLYDQDEAIEDVEHAVEAMSRLV